jgi:hypothetical protein
VTGTDLYIIMLQANMRLLSPRELRISLQQALVALSCLQQLHDAVRAVAAALLMTSL